MLVAWSASRSRCDSIHQLKPGVKLFGVPAQAGLELLRSALYCASMAVSPAMTARAAAGSRLARAR